LYVLAVHLSSILFPTWQPKKTNVQQQAVQFSTRIDRPLYHALLGLQAAMAEDLQARLIVACTVNIGVAALLQGHAPTASANRSSTDYQ
jgi:hypothetical protein